MAAARHAQPIADEIYADSIVIDGLNGSTLTPRVIDSLRRSGVTAVNLTAVRIGATWHHALDDLTRSIETIERNVGDLLAVRCTADIRRAKDSHRVGIILGLQDAEPIGDDLLALRTLHEMGVRIIQITHNRRCLTGTGCTEPDSGLTRFGKQLIEEMNRLGIVVDLSHCGPRTALEAIRCSSVPVICSHANPSAICPSPRNKSDEIITDLARRGGVIGLSAWSPIACKHNDRRPNLADVADCIDHVIRLVGPRHAGIGSDLCVDLTPTPQAWAAVYGPAGTFPQITGNLGNWYRFETNMAEGLEAAEDIRELAGELMQRGMVAADLRQVLGLNFLRVFEAAWSRNP